MRTFEELISSLEANSSGERDQAAMDLMELGNPRAFLPLLNAITKPENENYRGTLVYALSAFDCHDHLEELVDLVLTGN
jgi:HEAT repeat protein